MPLIVTTFDNHEPDTPVGKPANVAPVAPTVEYVMLVTAVLIHFVCAFVPTADVSVTVLLAVVVIVPVAVVLPHPPVVVTV